ncbi:MAG: DciA family protein [bacterium]
MSKNQPEYLGKILINLLRNLGIESKVKEHEVIVKWPIIVGQKISNITKAEKTVDGILFVKVKKNAWRSELIFLKKDILTKIDETIGAGIIKDIRFI